MDPSLDLEKLDVLKFARSIEHDCQEGVKWERRKLEWILKEAGQHPETEKEAA